MGEIFTAFGLWTWWILAGILFILELLAASVFFIWLGLAAVVMGILDLLTPSLSWQAEIGIFAVLSAVLVVAGRPWLRRRQEIDSDRPNLNRRIYDYVGKSYVLDEAIVDGRGKVKIEDTLWEVSGPDLPKGAWVKITGVDGLRLLAIARPDASN